MRTEFLPSMAARADKFGSIYVGTFPVPDGRGSADVVSGFSPGVNGEDRVAMADGSEDAIFFLPVLFVDVPIKARGVGGRGGAGRKGELTIRSLELESSFA